VGLLFGDPEIGEQVQNLVGLDFQLPRQLIDSNLLHRVKLSVPDPSGGLRVPVLLLPHTTTVFLQILLWFGTRVSYVTRLHGKRIFFGAAFRPGGCRAFRLGLTGAGLR